jgi:hypothetical protein
MSGTTTITSSSWTLEGWFKYTSTTTTKDPHLINITSNTDTLIIEINSTTGANYGKIRAQINGSAPSSSTQTDVTTLMNAGYTHIALTKSFANTIATYTVYVNGTQYLQVTSSTNINPTQIDFGSTTGSFSNPMRVDELRLSNYNTSGVLPSTAHGIVNYSTPNGFVFKTDNNLDTVRTGNITLPNNNIILNRSSYSLTSSEQDVATIQTDYILGSEGFQILDFNIVSSGLGINYATITNYYDLWSSRTATIPAVGASKVKVSSTVLNKFFFNYFNVEKADNVKKLTINQSFDFNTNTIIKQKNSLGATVAVARILEKDLVNNTISVGDITGTFLLNTGSLEASDFFINEIKAYTFANVNATTPGTFDFNIPGSVSAKFKDYSEDDYLIRIDATLPGSAYVVGSVVTINSNQISFNQTKTLAVITGLTAVTQISLVTNLTKVLTLTTILNTELMFIRSTTSHYLTNENVVFASTNPTYSPLIGTFDIYSIISKKEFLLKLRDVPTSSLGSSTLKIFVKNPIFKFIYGQQYTFDTAHTSMQGHYLSFYRDNLYKIEYTFKNITRKGTPGFDEPGNSPFISFKITEDASNITYYADPSNLGEDGPVNTSSYIDVITSPYIGTYTVTDLDGGSITQGPNKFKFIIPFEPEKTANVLTSYYSTTSTKTVGPIAKIKLVNGGGFYKKLPLISDIESSRKIERVEIVEPGTEYEAGEYFGVPILGDGAGGKVSLIVDGTTDPAGQIVEVTVTDPGKGYTNASIDVDGIDGILGPLLTGSGAVLNVVIPPKGSGAAIFTRGDNIGKIKKLKNNNFGFNYTHDYTLRPEITFPVNVQLSNTSILSSIKIIDPGTGYTTPPEVLITGGGGTGASAEAIIKNGRISDILVKNPGTGYSTPPIITLKSSFTYVVNLDLGLFQFAFPHGITNAVEVQFQNESLGPRPEFPLTSFGYLSPTQIYYAISGQSNGLQDDQLRIALTQQDAISGNYITFINGGTGRQIILTSSFGGSAEAIVETGRFLSKELVFQGESINNSSATGYVSVNEGWQTGPRLLKLIDVQGTFEVGQSVTGLISKANGTIENISIAKGVLEVNSITNTVGKFLDDVGKPSEIVQKIQDSYLYQQFSYNIKSPVSIEMWRNTVIDNVHPAGFKVFGEIALEGGGKGLSDKTDFELSKSVNLIESSVVDVIKNYAIVEPIYSDFDNTQILFRNKRLTSSEEILTSVVQRLDDIANLFDGERISFPITIDGSPVVADASQFLITINGIVQPPKSAFEIQQGNIVFSEPPPAPTKISYATVTVQFLTSTDLTIRNTSGILPELGNTIRGLTSNTTAIVIKSTTNIITVFNISGTGFQIDEVLIVAATGLNATLSSQVIVTNQNIFRFQESITNVAGDTAVIEEINLTNDVPTNKIVISKTSGTYRNPSGLLNIKLNDFIYSAGSEIIAKVIGIAPYIDPFNPNQFVSSISISDPSTFTGLLFTRIINPLKPNAVVDDISKSLIEVTNMDDDSEKYEINFVAYENAENILMDYAYNFRTAKTIVTAGNVTASTTESKFDGGSVYFDGDGDYLTVTNASDFNFGNYTLETWLYLPSLPAGTYSMVFSLTGGPNFYWGLSKSGSTLYLISYDGDTINQQSTGPTVQVGQWTHVAWSRTGSTIKSFVNGTLVHTGISSASANASGLMIGYDDTYVNQYQFNGYLDEIRVSNIVRYTATFTPSATPFINNINTVLLIHGNTNISDDGGSPSAVAADDLVQSVRINYTNQNNHFSENETLYIKKLSYHTLSGGNFNQGQIVTGVTSGATATIIGVNYALKFLYLGSRTGTFTSEETISSGAISAKVSQYIEVPIITRQVNTTNKYIIAPFIDASTQHRFRDAANLIRQNQTYIIDEAVGRMKARYTDLLIPGDDSTSLDGTNRCKLDLSLLLDAVATDLEYGGTYNTTGAARVYLDGNGVVKFIRLQLLQSLFAHKEMSVLCQNAVDGTLSTTPTYTNKIPYLPINITADTSSPVCANVKSAIDTLWNLVNDILAPTGQVFRDAADRIWFNKKFIAQESTGYIEQWARFTLNGVQNNAFTYPTGSSERCERDIEDFILPAIISDLLTGGNVNIIDAMKYYVVEEGGNITHVKDEILPTAIAFERVNILCQYAIDNWIINGTTNTSYTPLTGEFESTAVRTTDNTITPDDGTYGGNCERVKQAIDTLFNLAVGILIPERNEKYSRYYDASNLINSNKYLIADVAVGRMQTFYPGFTFPNGNQDCKDDIVIILDGIIYDLRNGGNARTWDNSEIYTFNSYLGGEGTPPNYAFNEAKNIANEIVTNVTVNLGGYTIRNQVKDLTITADPATGSNTSASSCADVRSSINTLFSILTTAVTNGNMNHAIRQSEDNTTQLYRDAAKLLLFNKSYIKNETVQKTLINFPGFSVPGGNAKCLRDIDYIIDAIVYDLLTGGNKGIVDATLTYIDAITGTITSLDGELIQSIYAYNQVTTFIKSAIAETLVVPSPAAGQYAYTDGDISITGTQLTTIEEFIDERMNILLGTLNNSEYININQIVGYTLIDIPTISYPTRSSYTPVSGEANIGDYIYGSSSNNYAEIESITYNRGTISDLYTKFRIVYDDPNLTFTNNTSIQVQGQGTKVAAIISTEESEYYTDLDVQITSGTFAVGNILIDDNGYTATITSIGNRLQLKYVIGSWESNVFVYGLFSDAEFTVLNYYYNNAPIISTTNSKLTLDTEGLIGQFKETRKVYSSISSYYIDVIDAEGTVPDLNSVIKTTTITKLRVSYADTTFGRQFLVGDLLQDADGLIPGVKSATIVNVEVVSGDLEVDLWIVNPQGTFNVGDTVSVFEENNPFPLGTGTVQLFASNNSFAYASIEKIVPSGIGYRYYLTNVVGTISPYSQLISSSNFKAGIINVVKIEGRIKRSFVGFNGVQDTFRITRNNGEFYAPDIEGYLLVFVNGILQPPDISFNVFNDTIQFSEAPSLGSSFHAVYLGKLRQLDDISFQFDSLRSTFNLKLNDSFYSLTITEGVSSTTIKPENNIIISLNGVIQEPGVAYQLVGSRIIFAEVPRAGSTFVAFSYIGSDVDVIASEVVPPIEVTDRLVIEGETEEREVAIIESSNSLITFDYLGSVLGRNAEALVSVITGRVTSVQLTSGGSGYTSRPNISFNSSTGFDAQAKALVGISGVQVIDGGSGYSYPIIEIDTSVPNVPPEFGFKFDDTEVKWDTNAVTFDQQ